MNHLRFYLLNFLTQIYFGNIGVFIFKVFLTAVKSGEIDDKKKLEIKVKIKEKKK